MKRESDVKELLIANAIHLIAIGGFEKATTKELTHCGGSLPGFKMNEVYIYRVFGSKEALYDAAFSRLDHELFYTFQSQARAVGGFMEDTRNRFGEFFQAAWGFILGNEEKCRCYVRYYYSVYFRDESLAKHKKLFNEMIVAVAPVFKQDCDVEAVLHSVFTAMFDFAIRVYNHDLANSEENRRQICNVLYCMMMTYFQNPQEAS